MASLIYQTRGPVLGNFDRNSWIDKDNMADKSGKDNPSFFKGEFSFVNKDARNIDSKDHNAAVSWHVMNRYERWKKQEQAKKLRASANVPVGPMSATSISKAVRRHRGSLQRSLQLTTLQPIITTPTAPFGFDPWIGEQPLQVGYSRPSPTQPPAATALPSATSTPSTQSSLLEDPFSSMWNTSNTSVDLGATTDAFDSSIVPSSPLATSLVCFAYTSLVANTWPTEPGSVPGAYELTRSWDDITAISQDQCYANAYLGLLAAAMADANADDSPLVQARQFKGQAMAELRRRVARNTAQDLLTLKAILKLFSAETMADNTSVARVHLKMLRNLVTAGGGVILLDSWFREDLLSCDCYFAVKYGTRPTLPAQEWTPGPLSQPWKARLISAGIFGDHSATVDPAIEHPILKAVVTDLRELFKTQEYILANDMPADEQLLRWRQMRKFDCLSRLADHYTNLSIYPHLYEKPRTQAMTTTTLLLLMNMVLGSPEPVRLGLKLLSDVKTKFQESEREAGSEDSRLRVWAAYIGSLAEKIHPVAGPAAGFFGASMKTLVRSLRVEDLDGMKKILRQLLFSEKLHLEIEGGRSFRKSDFRTGFYSSCGTSWRQPITMITSPPIIGEGSATGKQRARDG